MDEETRSEVPEEPEAAAGDGQEGEPNEPSEVEGLKAQIEQLTQDLAAKEALLEEHHQRYLRLAADFDNFRRRTRNEREELTAFAAERLIRNVLPVVDNLERAMDAPEGQGLRDGVELTLRKLREVIESEGVQPIEALGRPFDPRLHEAIMQEGEGDGEPVVAEEFQKGYRLGDRVLRPSMVKVVRTAPEPK